MTENHSSRPLDAPAGPEMHRSGPPLRRASRFTADRLIRVLMGLGALAALMWVVWFFASLVIYLLTGIVLAYLLKPLVDRVQGFGLGRISSIAATFLLAGRLIGLLIVYLLPFLEEQVSDLYEQISFERVAQITAVEPGSPAEEAGVQPDEFIVAVEGRLWTGYSQFESVLRTKDPRDTVLVLVRNEAGATRSLPLVLPRRAKTAEPVPARVSEAGEERHVASLGLMIREVSLSEVSTFLETRLRKIMPVEHGALVNGLSSAFEELFRGERITETVGSVLNVFTNLFYALVVIPFTTFFFLKDGGEIRRYLLHFVPNRYFEITLAIIEKIETNIGRYFRALFFQVVSIITVASLLLKLTGLYYWLAVGIFTGSAVLIPYVGPFLGFIVGAIVGVAQTGDASLVPGVFVAMILTHIFDNVVVQPFIFSRATRSHPLVILFAVLIGAKLAGIIGMLVAIPLTATIRVTIEQIFWSLRNYRILQPAP